MEWRLKLSNFIYLDVVIDKNSECKKEVKNCVTPEKKLKYLNV